MQTEVVRNAEPWRRMGVPGRCLPLPAPTALHLPTMLPRHWSISCPVFRWGYVPDDKKRAQIAWSGNRNQAACQHRSNRRGCCVAVCRSNRGMKNCRTGGFLRDDQEDSATDCLFSVPTASPPNEKNENCDQSGDDQHPVLAFKAQKRKMPDQKLHRSRPRFWAE